MGLCWCHGAPFIAEEQLSEEVLAKLALNAAEFARIPGPTDKVFKDECMFSLDTPYAPAGLYINLISWQGFGIDFVALDQERTRAGSSGPMSPMLYLRRMCHRIPKASDASKPSTMAIGVEGGFSLEQFETKEECCLAVFNADYDPDKLTPKPMIVHLPCLELPEHISRACEAIMNHEGAGVTSKREAWTVDQEKKVSKYAENLIQLPAKKKISPSSKDWRCEKSGDTQNLWLNLSDGSIGGGRAYFDGSGGSNGALDHYKDQLAKGNNYPLVVKLGTITPHGADVFSYAEDEDDLVIDPKLADHLAHWGIDIMKMEKSDKTMAEMEVDLNMNYDWSKICETGEQLEIVRGPGLMGLKNLGNSCYLNSTLQLLVALPELGARYADNDCALRRGSPPAIADDFIAQFAKVLNALLTQRYAGLERHGSFQLAPQMFRTLIGRGHPEFSTDRQQDVAEFLQHLLDLLARAERPALGNRLPHGKSIVGLLEFEMEERYECSATHQVSYKRRKGCNILVVPVRLEDAENADKISAPRKGVEATEGQPEKPKALIPLNACLNRLVAPESGVSFRGRSCSKTIRLATMPRYMMVQVQRYYVDEKWTPCKLDCAVPMPDVLDLESLLRGRGLQQSEVEMPEEAEPLATTQVGATTDSAIVDPDQIGLLMAMGFTEPHVRAALKACQNSVDRAADWLFSHADDLDAAIAAADMDGDSTTLAGDPTEDGIGKYELCGFVSHVGKNTSSGHYVCHVKKSSSGGWIIFNDEKVAKSENPPKDLGYLYLYRRCT